MSIIKFGYLIAEYTKWKYYTNEVCHCIGFNTRKEAETALDKRKEIINNTDELSYGENEVFSYEESAY